tara:strand:- start:3595 stop:3933 length:339 start_codon:yes stop_codon:yes gene_type:complete
VSVAHCSITPDVSIHAAREGRDGIVGERARLRGVSIHAAREGRDFTANSLACKPLVFQSTRPVKAATRACGVKQSVQRVSIHAAREGRDEIVGYFCDQAAEFQSTRPVKAAT